MLPSFSVYGPYSNSNYGAHALVFTDANGNRFYFSYKTLVAFDSRSGGLVVHENDWGPTTGKHLNAIDGGSKSRRVNDVEFNRIFKATYGREVKAA